MRDLFKKRHLKFYLTVMHMYVVPTELWKITKLEWLCGTFFQLFHLPRDGHRFLRNQKHRRLSNLRAQCWISIPLLWGNRTAVKKRLTTFFKNSSKSVLPERIQTKNNPPKLIIFAQTFNKISLNLNLESIRNTEL